MAKLNELKFFLKKEKVKELYKIITDLSKINKTIKIKIEEENTIMYSLAGGDIILALKSYAVKTNDFFMFDDELDKGFDIIIDDSKKFVKNLAFYDGSVDVKGTINYKQQKSELEYEVARIIRFNDGRFNFRYVCGETHVVKDVTYENLKFTTSPSNTKWKFNVDLNDFNDIKKIASNSEDKIVTVSTNNNHIFFGDESSWELNVGDISEDHPSVTFEKKYLSSFPTSETIELRIYEAFILIHHGDVTLMVSFEQTYD